tara:strand:+ start:176 stop:322 length:147 start_codon:yes stop_codon:yes gene_type:complete
VKPKRASVIKDENDYEKVEDGMKKMVRRLMMNRLKQVERVVCDHLTLL